MALDEHTARKIQSYGEQHPDFHSKEMKEYRKADKAKAREKKEHLARKMKVKHEPSSKMEWRSTQYDEKGAKEKKFKLVRHDY